jgi:predicted  nucleic acid-binding Zn ribbon protein
MPKPVYISFCDLTHLQQDIMRYVGEWVRVEKTPIPLKEIIDHMKKEKVKSPTVTFAIKGLLLKGYLRRACIISNKTYFVQLRSI